MLIFGPTIGSVSHPYRGRRAHRDSGTHQNMNFLRPQSSVSIFRMGPKSKRRWCVGFKDDYFVMMMMIKRYKNIYRFILYQKEIMIFIYFHFL